MPKRDIKAAQPMAIVATVGIVTFQKNEIGIASTRVTISAKKAAYNPITDQYIKLKWMALQFLILFFMIAANSPNVMEITLAVAAR